MSLEFLYPTNYIEFILPAFIFTFVSCLKLYLITKNEFKKYENLFLKKDKKEKLEKVKSTKSNQATSGSFVY